MNEEEILEMAKKAKALSEAFLRLPEREFAAPEVCGLALLAITSSFLITNEITGNEYVIEKFIKALRDDCERIKSQPAYAIIKASLQDEGKDSQIHDFISKFMNKGKA